MFGPAHIIAVLRGSRAGRVLSRSHERLSCYGEGREYSAEQWGAFVREFIRLGLVDAELEFGGLRLTKQGRDVLEGISTVSIPLDQSPVATETARESLHSQRGTFPGCSSIH
jgi:ATP-dependent DNA helicase RecQ